MAEPEVATLEGGEAVALETPPTPAPEVEPDHKAEAQRFKAEAETLRQEKARLEQQLRSTQGALKRPLDIEAALQRNLRETARLREKFDLLADAQLAGDERYTALQARHLQEDAQDNSAAGLIDRINDIRTEVAEVYGKEWAPGEDATEIDGLLATSPEFKAAYDLTLQGWNTKNPQILQQARRKAREVGRAAQLRRQEAEVKAAREQAKREALDEAGVLEIPNPKAAGGGGGVLRGIIKESEIAALWPKHKDEILRAQEEGRIKVGE